MSWCLFLLPLLFVSTLPLNTDVGSVASWVPPGDIQRPVPFLGLRHPALMPRVRLLCDQISPAIMWQVSVPWSIPRTHRLIALP